MEGRIMIDEWWMGFAYTCTLPFQISLSRAGAAGKPNQAGRGPRILELCHFSGDNFILPPTLTELGTCSIFSLFIHLFLPLFFLPFCLNLQLAISVQLESLLKSLGINQSIEGLQPTLLFPKNGTIKSPTKRGAQAWTIPQPTIIFISRTRPSFPFA